jgi:septal ring factor EnvC (AmiA/AmiB activator)
MVDTKSISNQTIRVSTGEFVYSGAGIAQTSDQVAVEQQDLSLESTV